MGRTRAILPFITAMQDMLSIKVVTIAIREEYGTISSHDMLVQGLSYAQLLAANGNWQDARKRLFA